MSREEVWYSLASDAGRFKTLATYAFGHKTDTGNALRESFLEDHRQASRLFRGYDEESTSTGRQVKLALILSIALTGCSVYSPKAPLPPTISNHYLADLSSPTLLSTYDAMPESPAKVARRNAILYEYIWLVDANYYPYEVGFFSGQAYVSTAADLAVMGTDAAAAVTGTAMTKAILAAVAGGVVGTRNSFQKNFMDQITRENIVAQMRASRLSTLAEITQSMNMNGLGYSLEQGLLDVAAYYRDGTVISAVEAISNSTSQQANTARQAMKTLRGIR